MHARPIRKRRAGDDDGSEQLGAERRQNHHRPSTLAIADDAGLAIRVGVQRRDLLEKNRLGARNILDGLPGHWFGEEAHEITRMS
jgi:hypothetical protein